MYANISCVQKGTTLAFLPGSLLVVDFNWRHQKCRQRITQKCYFGFVYSSSNLCMLWNITLEWLLFIDITLLLLDTMGLIEPWTLNLDPCTFSKYSYPCKTKIPYPCSKMYVFSKTIFVFTTCLELCWGHWFTRPSLIKEYDAEALRVKETSVGWTRTTSWSPMSKKRSRE